MAVRSCTCGAARRALVGGLVRVVGVVDEGGVRHYRDCAALLPDPDACPHPRARRYNGFMFCSACGKGMSEGGPAWVRDSLRPGYAEEHEEKRRKTEERDRAARAREASYNVGDVRLDFGVTDLTDDELARLLDACTREQAFRA